MAARRRQAALDAEDSVEEAFGNNREEYSEESLEFIRQLGPRKVGAL
jgi:hypothetical protein